MMTRINCCEIAGDWLLKIMQFLELIILSNLQLVLFKVNYIMNNNFLF